MLNEETPYPGDEAVVRSRGQIEQAADRLDDRTEALQDLVGALTGRLAPILQNERAEKATEAARDTPADPVSRSILATRLDDTQDRLGMLARRISQLMDRVDL